jgi:hypothetical protein
MKYSKYNSEKTFKMSLYAFYCFQKAKFSELNLVGFVDFFGFLIRVPIKPLSNEIWSDRSKR